MDTGLTNKFPITQTAPNRAILAGIKVIKNGISKYIHTALKLKKKKLRKDNSFKFQN